MKVGTPPSVSVVLAVYNGERFLADALDSLLVQSLSDFEVVVIDDGSTDTTPGLLHGYASRDPRVTVRRQRNLGRAAALNVGIGLARAALIARIDADDIAMPRRLDRQRSFLAENPEVAGVGGSVVLIDDQGNEFAEANYPLSHPEVRAAFWRNDSTGGEVVRFGRHGRERGAAKALRDAHVSFSRRPPAAESRAFFNHVFKHDA